MLKFIGTLVLCFLCSQLLATPVAVIDSGTDFEHYLIKKSKLASSDIPGNGLDDDGSGYIDDAHGWNFAEMNNVQVDRKIIPAAFPDYVRGLSILMSLSAELQVSNEDYEWIKELWNGPEGPHFRQEINKTANFSHGTHVGGIIVKESFNAAELMAIQIMPTVKFSDKLDQIASDHQPATKEITDEQIIEQFKIWAKQNENSWKDEINLLTFRGIKVANCSFGFGYKHSKLVAASVCRQLSIECDEDRLDKLGRAFLKYYKRPDSIRLLRTDPEILFTIAAGNDALDNDVYPDEPANLLVDNRIVVGSIDHQGLSMARFSNYGKVNVDVFAPGEVIESSYPNDLLGTMSGTSQAAPYVAGVAAVLLETNPKLNAKSLKTLLIKTVDKQDWLKDKCASGGIVNRTRALRAAELSKKMALRLAIKKAEKEVGPEFRFGFRSFSFFPYDSSMLRFTDKLISNSRKIVF